MQKILNKQTTYSQQYKGINIYNVIKKIGNGSFGDVYLVQNIKNQKYYAMKTLEIEKLTQNDNLKYAFSERSIIKKCNSPFIIKLYHSFETERHLIMILDYCPGGDLYSLLQIKYRFQEDLARKYLSEVLLAIEELHVQDIMYRDMKPENIVICSDGHTKLIDFGLSKENIGKTTSQSFCGSGAYLAPEIIGEKGHNKSVDWYQFGILAYELIVGQPPFNYMDKQTLYFYIQNKQVEFPHFVSDNAQDLIRNVFFINYFHYFLFKLLHKQPELRLGGTGGALQIKKHQFFEGIIWENVNKKQLDMHIPNFENINNEKIDVSFKIKELTEQMFPNWYFLDQQEITL
ncbi:protein kinase domain protein [Ichthyophthirius multifiliis]|uniref:Protein kinase domain protein n=1 Tax=Ichthyophthirius multifiliis TaxID=5932 RepID=G0QNC7_ICHMU|nr:protein kinase domain protein [Ichthyophthirius multifiliis]EGR33260.1 protein kinase domain protein [Ichthyophthirius multifiliis]|eukprot:XP_004037246.1 protein kinase domain protein [Ichthyophthirius multifiliis]